MTAAVTLSMALLLARSGTSEDVKERVEALVAECKANITVIESQIKGLEGLRAREYSIIAALRVVVAPARTLPTDLLGRIFRLAMDGWKTGGGWTAAVAMKDVLAVSHVCRQWRKAALDTPQLWATQQLPVFSTIRPGDALVAATKVMLERSAPLPIPVSLGLGYEVGNAAPILDVLFATPNRWRTLTLSTKLLGTLAQIPAGGLTALETLDLRNTSPASADALERRPNTNNFLLAPRLRRVTLWHVKDTDMLPMPWSQLTTLALADESPRVCLEIISRCSNLISATLHMSGWPESVSLTDTDPVTLPNLQSLEMHISNTSSDEHFTPFLQRLSLPSLTALKMYGEYHSGVITWSATAFTHFQVRSPSIERLQIDHCALTSEDLQAAVQHAPSLTHLEIYNCSNCIDDAFLDVLRYVPSGPNAPLVVPKLEVLWLSSLRCDFEESTLKNMIESRWWTDEEALAMPAPPAVVRLRDVRYTSSRKFSHKFERAMRVYRAEGLGIQTLVA